MSSNYTSYQYNLFNNLPLEPRVPPKPLEQMSDQEVAAAVVERLKFPFLCKSCGRRVKEVDSGGSCSNCTGWWSWATNITITTTHASATTTQFTWGMRSVR